MMRGLLRIALASAWSRRLGLGLVVLVVALAVFLLLTVERVRADVRTQFSSAVSGTDLLVGARSGSVQLLLYSVFRLGSAAQNMRWSSVQDIANEPDVAWTIPLSLGDSHRGFAVIATNDDYFKHFRYGRSQALALQQGKFFADMFDVVLGADVAAQLGYQLGEPIVLSHGDGSIETNDHDDKPFTVVGILARTGTPVDRSLHIKLEGMQAIHLDWQVGAPLPGMAVSAEHARHMDVSPKSVTAVLVGLKSRTSVFWLQRLIAAYPKEPLTAVLPGVALNELWQLLYFGERALQVMSALLALVSLVGLVAVIIAGLEPRRRELAVLRAIGASPAAIFLLLLLEGFILVVLALLLGCLSYVLALQGLGPWLQTQFGLLLTSQLNLPSQWCWLAAVLATAMLASCVPGWLAYRLALADGLQPRT